MNTDIALLNITDVCQITRLSASTIRRLIQQEDFPAGHVLGGGRRVWRSDELNTWISTRTAPALADPQT